MAAADFLILSLSAPDALPASINRWIETCLQRDARRPLGVVVALDSDDIWTLSVQDATAPATRPARSLADHLAAFAQRSLAAAPFQPRAFAS